MKTIVWAGVALVGLAASVSAQQSTLNARVAAAHAAKFQIPLCNLKSSNGNTNDAAKDLRSAVEEKDAGKRARGIEGARKALVESTGKDPKDGAAWYYLARLSLIRGDVGGADSDFAKAQALNPTCETDINAYRQNTWALLANAGIEFQRKGLNDSALALFGEASKIFQGLPHVYSNTGVIYANMGKNDSGAVNFARALAIAEKDSTLKEDRDNSALNLAAMQQRLNRHTDAVATLYRYIRWKQEEADAGRAKAKRYLDAGKADSANMAQAVALSATPAITDARKSLAGSFRAAGMTDSADAVEKSLVADLSTVSTDSLSAEDLMAVGVGYFNSKKYKEAADVFAKAVSRNPNNRDAQYDLANCYLELKEGQKLVDVASKLVANEPMGEDILRLLATGYKMLSQQDQLMKTAERVVGLMANVEISQVRLGESEAKLTLSATGRKAMTAAGKAIPPGPVSLIVEFVDATGAVKGSQDISIPALDEGKKHEANASAKASGIVGWRYRVK